MTTRQQRNSAAVGKGGPAAFPGRDDDDAESGKDQRQPGGEEKALLCTATTVVLPVRTDRPEDSEEGGEGKEVCAAADRPGLGEPASQSR